MELVYLWILDRLKKSTLYIIISTKYRERYSFLEGEIRGTTLKEIFQTLK